MLKSKLIKLLMISIILLTATVIHSQETQPINSANDSVRTRLAPSGVKAIQTADDVCEQRLLKALDALEKSEALTRALTALVEKQTQLLTINDEIIKKKDAVISDQDKLIRIYEKQKGRQISFLWGIVRIKF